MAETSLRYAVHQMRKRYRAFLWKDKEAKSTLCVEVTDLPDVPETDPEFAVFCNSFGGK